MADIELGHGSGSSLPFPVLALAGVSTIVAVAVSGVSIWLQLRNYRKPLLQRAVVRIMVMVPLYAVASLISLFSLEAAFFIDVVRDIYEAFVIYCFFVLLLDYLGGERSLLILLHGRPPIPAVFPVNLWRGEIDPSDPYTFLFLKRGILQYVQVKPLLALASLIMKATGTYNEGDFRARSGYLYVSIVYNMSICLALWCLAVFWMCVHDDLKPFRPVPKFLCVKGILFFSFWQSIAVSFLVAVRVITRLGPYTDSEHISLGLTDTLICIEMPFFAAAHMYAFSYRDFITPPAGNRPPIYVARMALGYALRDAVGLKDLVEDTRATLRGKGINYRAFEPSEGAMHIGAARDRRIRAGLRYASGGRRKYWLPEVADDDVTAPLFAAAADEDGPSQRGVLGDDVDGADEDAYALTFGDALVAADELLYEDAKSYVFGDYLYPVVDVSSEEARRAMWAEEERVVREIVSSGFSRADGCGCATGYGATQNGKRQVRPYDGDDAPCDAGRSPWSGRTPEGSPRQTSDKPALSSQAPARTYLSPQPHLPHRLSSAVTTPVISRSVSAATTRSASSSPRMSKRAGHAPLVAEDAVDLVVAADVPSASRAPRSPHSPVLIRVWEEESAGEGVRVRADEGDEADGGTLARVQGSVAGSGVRVVITADDAGVQQSDGKQTPPPDAHVDGLRYGFGIPEGEGNHNPWA